MGNKSSQIFDKVLATAGTAAGAVGNIAKGALEGGSAAGLAGPEAMPIGAIIGGLTSGLGQVSDVVNKGKAIWDGTDTPATAESIQNTIQGGQKFAQSLAGGMNLLPQGTQNAIRGKVQAATEGKIGRNVVMAGKLMEPGVSLALRKAYAGKILPHEAEKVISPVLNAARSGLNLTQNEAVDAQRQVAYLDRLQPQPQQPPPTSELSTTPPAPSTNPG